MVDELFKSENGLPILFEYYSYLKIKERFLNEKVKIIGTHNLMIKSEEVECEIDLLILDKKEKRARFIGECTILKDKGAKRKQLEKACQILNQLNIVPTKKLIITPNNLQELLQTLP